MNQREPFKRIAIKAHDIYEACLLFDETMFLIPSGISKASKLMLRGCDWIQRKKVRQHRQ
jgi:hypothetical protein